MDSIHIAKESGPLGEFQSRKVKDFCLYYLTHSGVHQSCGLARASVPDLRLRVLPESGGSDDVAEIAREVGRETA